MTELAKQLSQLKQRQPLQRVAVVKKASVLFDPQKARDYPDEMVLKLGQQGLVGLDRVSPHNFSQFLDLLGESSLTLRRSMLPLAEQAPLSTRLKLLLALLSLHLQSDHAWQVLEALIRLFQVHVYECEEMLAYFVHAIGTPHYKRVLSTLHKEYGLNRPVEGLAEVQAATRLTPRDGVTLLTLSRPRLQLYHAYIACILQQIQSADPRPALCPMLHPFSFYVRLRLAVWQKAQHSKHR
jgi:hypothetical protein